MATTRPDDFHPRPTPAMPHRSCKPDNAQQVLDSLAALSDRADAVGLEVTAARLRALSKLACAEMVQVRLTGLV